MRFTIKKGKHYHSNIFARIFFLNFRKEIKYFVKFDNSCWYNYVNNDSNDLNKVFGYGGVNNQKRSARFAWKPDFDNEGILKIYAYVYDNGKRIIEYVCDIKTDDQREFILKKKNGFEFFISSENKHIPVNGRIPTWIKFWPYFGGNNKAPHNITIELKK